MDIKRIIVATSLSAAIVVGFDYFVPQHAKKDVETQTTQQAKGQAPTNGGKVSALPVAAPGGAPANSPAAAVGPAGRIAIEGPDATGSFSLRGARFDNLVLTHYRETLDKDSPLVRLLANGEAPEPSFVELAGRLPPDPHFICPMPIRNGRVRTRRCPQIIRCRCTGITGRADLQDRDQARSALPVRYHPKRRKSGRGSGFPDAFPACRT